MNYWRFWISIAVIAIFSFLLSRDILARTAWQKYENAYLALSLAHRDGKLAMQLGNYYFGGGKYDLKNAEIAYKKALSAEPGILWGHYQLARVYFVKGDYNKALLEINRELEANPENLRSLYVRGLIYGYRNQAEDLGKAEADFKRFTLWAPKEWAGYNDLSWILSKEEKYAEAEKTIHSAFREISDALNNSWLWNSLGVAELNLKKYSDAAYSFKKAKKLAAELTVNDWIHAYPGNNPSAGGTGLSVFLKAINENLVRAESKK